MLRPMLIAGLLLGLLAAAPADSFTIRLPDEELAVSRTDYQLPGTSFVDLDKLGGLTEHLKKRVYQPPRNAAWNAHRAIVPEASGKGLDEEKFTARFYEAIGGRDHLDLQLPMKDIYPRVDSELLQQISEKVIGQYTTYYNARNKNRSHNIALAAEAINNAVIFPGETFSFNGVVGKRTKGKGYLNAPIIVRGELSEGVGGGICQVSSTLFNAVDRAGLKIVQRYSHSRNVTYVRPGRDATVSWYGPDFIFENGYDVPVLIRAVAGRGSVYIAVYSAETLSHQPRQVPPMNRAIPEEVEQSRVMQDRL
jgi:vancomycin resistance protein YoaR